MKSVLIVLLMTMPFWGFSQIEKGNWLLGGSGSFSSQKYKGATSSDTYYDVSPNVGYFLTKNLALGLDLSLSGYPGRSILIGVNPFARYYLNKTFGQVSYLTNTAGFYSSRGFDLSIGHSLFLGEHAAFEPEIYYRSINGFNDNKSYGLRVGFQIYW